jgi:hypothetical protein
LVDRVHGMPRSSSAAVNSPVFRPVREVIADAGDAAVVRDDAAAVTMDYAADEFFGLCFDEILFPRFESNRHQMLLSGTMLWQQARPVFGVQRDLGAVI